MEKIHVLDGTRANGSPIHLPESVAEIVQIMEASNAKLLSIDPFDSIFPPGENPNGGPDIRRVLGPLNEAAMKHGFSVVIVRHMNKKSGESALYRGAGSIGATALTRAAFNVGYHPKNKKGEEFTRVFCPQKFNLGKRPPSLEFTTEVRPVLMDDLSTQQVSYAEWHGESDITADELTGAAKIDGESLTKQQRAQRIIQNLLLWDSRPEHEVREAVLSAGIGETTYKAARKTLGVTTKPNGFGGAWLLSLPKGEREDRDPDRGDATENEVASESGEPTTVATTG